MRCTSFADCTFYEHRVIYSHLEGTRCCGQSSVLGFRYFSKASNKVPPQISISFLALDKPGFDSFISWFLLFMILNMVERAMPHYQEINILDHFYLFSFI